MSHYGLLLDLAKMYDGRSRAIFSFQAITTTTATASVLLLLLLQQQQQLLATAMSLDRQALERNELPPAVAVDPISSSSSSSSSASLPFSSPELVVDDMKMTPLGNTDMYMLVPDPLASQVDNTEHVHRNTIEAEAEAQAEAESAADMLMLESEDTPSMHLVELPSDVAETQTETQAAELQTEAVPILKEEEVAASPELETEEHVVEQPVSKQEQEQEQQSQAENDETAPEPEPETDPEKEEKMELSTPAMIVEESKPELETAVENNDELEATESTVLASMSASSEEGISAVISELLPEELNIAQEDNQKQEQVQDHEAQEMLFQQPEEIETQTLAVLSDVETATEQQEQHLVALMPEAVVLADPIEEAPVEQVMPEETQSENEHETEADNPVETPVETPSDTPVEGPIEEPVESLAETPVETPIKTPVEALVDAPIETEQQAAPETGKPETSNDAEIMLPVKEVPSMPEQPEAVETAIAIEPESQKPAEILADEVHDAAVTQIEDQAEPQATVHTEILADELQQNQAEPEQSMLTTIIPMVVVPQQMQEEPQPLHVMDSVLNYVNGSFVQQEQQHDEGQQVAAVQTETTFNAQLRRYDGAQVWRIVVQTDKDKKLADELQSKYDGQLWKEVKQEVDYLLKPQVLAAAERHIRAANLSRIVLIDNLQQVIEVENPPAEKIAELQNRKGHRLTWQAYHRLEDIHGFIDYMAKTYPDICSTETIGHSVEKRPLKILKISNGNAQNPGIWIDGGMHAREWISPSTVTYIANQLVEGWEDLPEHMRNINWYIHPVANPDGYEYSHTTDRLWRKNMRAHGRQCPGVDLNRNFGYKWGGKGTSASPCSQTYRGSKAFSEPETFYISKFISGFPRETFQAYLSFHSYGQYILYPWGYDYHLTKDRADLDRVARQAGSIITKSSGVKYTVGSSATTLYPAAGGSDDWAKGIAGIKYAYTIEMGDTGRYGFVLPAQFIPYNGKDGYTFADTVARAVVQGRSQDARSSNSNRRRSR